MKKYLLTLLCRFLVRLHAPLTRDPFLWGLYVALVFRQRDDEPDNDHAGRLAAAAVICARFIGVAPVVNEIARDAIERNDPCVSLYSRNEQQALKH